MLRVLARVASQLKLKRRARKRGAGKRRAGKRGTGERKENEKKKKPHRVFTWITVV